MKVTRARVFLLLALLAVAAATIEIKISQLTETTSLGTNDWFLVSKQTSSASNWGSRKANWTNLINSLTNVNALSIGLAAVDNTEFGYLDGVTSALQPQFAARPTGSGTANTLAKFSSSTVLGNSIITDDGSNVGVGTASPTAKLHVNGTILVAGITNSVGTANTIKAFGANKEEKSIALSGATFDGTTLTITSQAGGFTNTATAVLTFGSTVTPDIDAIPNITRNCRRDIGYTITLTGNVTTFNVPTATPIHHDEVTLEVLQTTGGNTITFASGYRYGTDSGPSITLSIVAGYTDWIKFKYSTNSSKWDVVAIMRGYAP